MDKREFHLQVNFFHRISSIPTNNKYKLLDYSFKSRVGNLVFLSFFESDVVHRQGATPCPTSPLSSELPHACCCLCSEHLLHGTDCQHLAWGCRWGEARSLERPKSSIFFSPLKPSKINVHSLGSHRGKRIAMKCSRQCISIVLQAFPP